jgi:hypothetical protein
MQPDIPPEAAFAFIAVIAGVILVVSLAVQLVICLLVYKCAQRIPEQYQQIPPGHVWLLMIPCFAIIWNFFVFPKIAAGYAAYFRAHEDTSVGDCGAQLALIYCIAVCCSLVPIVQYVAGPASLVLLIIVLVKFWELRGRIPEGASPGMAPPAAM